MRRPWPVRVRTSSGEDDDQRCASIFDSCQDFRKVIALAMHIEYQNNTDLVFFWFSVSSLLFFVFFSSTLCFFYNSFFCSAYESPLNRVKDNTLLTIDRPGHLCIFTVSHTWWRYFLNTYSMLLLLRHSKSISSDVSSSLIESVSLFPFSLNVLSV